MLNTLAYHSRWCHFSSVYSIITGDFILHLCFDHLLFPEREHSFYLAQSEDMKRLQYTGLKATQGPKGRQTTDATNQRFRRWLTLMFRPIVWQACQMMLDRAGSKQARGWLNRRFLAGDERKVVQHDATWFHLSCLTLEPFTKSNPVRSGHMHTGRSKVYIKVVLHDMQRTCVTV